MIARPHRQFTVDEVMRMVEAGILADNDRLELIEGELVQMSPQHPVHSALTMRIHALLMSAFGEGFAVRDHSPLQLGEHNLPEPDVVVVRGSPEAYMVRHPVGEDVVLVVEISVSSHRADRAKAGMYALGGVALYWQVDVPGRRVTVYSAPDTQRGEYTRTALLGEQESVEVAGSTLQVERLLPPAD